MVEPILYASFGALIATLLGLMFLPLFWRRAVHLTRKQLIGRLPVSASEIVAAQDRLRAEHAMSLRRTERKAERVMSDATRDRVESARARSTELGHLADLADLRAKITALEAEGARVRGQLELTGQESAAAFDALKEARAAADAAAKDLQAARQDASASRAATEQARIETAARVAEITALREQLGGAKSPTAAAAAPSGRLRLPKADTPFGALADEPVAPAPDALAALRKRLDEVADDILRAAEASPVEDKPASKPQPIRDEAASPNPTEPAGFATVRA